MRTVVRTTEAEEDLIGIWIYIARDNPAAADDTLRGIEEKFSMLAENPRIGKALPELRKGMRRWPFGEYLILYREIPMAWRSCASSTVHAISSALCKAEPPGTFPGLLAAQRACSTRSLRSGNLEV